MQGIALNLSGDTAPDWIQLTPPGPRIVGRDGRNWRMTDPAAVVKAFASSSQRPHIDIEHSTQLKGPKGEPAPAVGWIEDMEVRDGALWGRVDWTAEGLNAVSSRAYRYLSPAFTFDRRSNEVLRMVSAGLTNNPNLDMAALNASDDEENDESLLGELPGFHDDEPDDARDEWDDADERDDAPDDAAAGDSQGEAVEDDRDDVEDGDEPNDAPSEQDSAQTESAPPAQVPQRASHSRKSGRPSVPSWDDIMFGGRGPKK